MSRTKNIAIIGSGMAGIACARTLMQAGHKVTVFEKDAAPGGRMATQHTAFGSFDPASQYFTVRDARFAKALETVPGLCRPWSANTVRVLDEHGLVVAAAPAPAREPHWVPVPGMDALLARWARPLADNDGLELQTQVTGIERDALDAHRWQLRTSGAQDAQHVFSGFDAVLLAMPAPQAQHLLQSSAQGSDLAQQLGKVQIAPCWTLMLAYPQAMQPGMSSLGPQWNAARSTHHRVAWLARESSKPRRERVERWTVQAGAAWSREHLADDPERVQAKLIKAFAEITGIRAEPAHAAVHLWRHAQTTQALGNTHLWDAASHLGACGDWCIGYRVEDAFISGLELALTVA